MKKIIIITLLCFFFAGPALSVESWNINEAGELLDYWYDVNDFKLVGNRLYAAFSTGGIRIIDITEPTEPQVIQGVDLQEVSFVDVNNEMMFVYSGNILYSINIADELSPVICDSLINFEGIPCGFNLVESTLFIASRSTNGSIITSVDVSDPYNLNAIASSQISYRFFHIDFEGNYGFFTCNSNRVIGLDVSNPLDIDVVSDFPIPSGSSFLYANINVDSTTAYVSADRKLYVLDVRYPNDIRLRSEYEANSDIGVIHADGDLLFAAGPDDLRLFDVSDILSPQLLIQESAPDFFMERACGHKSLLENGVIILSTGQYDPGDRANILSIIDVSEDMELTLLSKISGYEYLRDVIIQDNYLFAIGEKITIADISDPLNEEIIAVIDKKFEEIKVKDNYVYCWKSEDYEPDSLFVFSLDNTEIIDPLYRVEIQEADSYGTIYEFSINDNFLIFSKWCDFIVFDNSNPSQPPEFLYEQRILGYQILTFCVKDDFLYVSTLKYDGPWEDYYQFKVFSIDETSIVNIANVYVQDYDDFSTMGPYDHLAIDDNVAVIGSDRYVIINIRNPRNPSIFYRQTEGESEGIIDLKMSNDYLLATTDYGLRAINLWNPEAPVLSGYYNDFSYTSNFDTVDDLIYLRGVAGILVVNAESALSIENKSGVSTPFSYKISRAYPNPFNPSLNVQVALPETGLLRLTVHNVLGQEVAVMNDHTLSAGHHNFTFNGSDLSSGIYFVKAVVEGKMNDVQKVVLMK